MTGVAVAYAGLVVAAIQNRPGRRGGFLRGTSRGNLREGKFFAYGRIGKIGTGALITRSIEDADRIGDVINTLMSALSAIPFTLILGHGLAFRKDWVLAVFSLHLCPCCLSW